MKELSIEEKAKRYDEALKCAMIYYKNGNEDMKMMMKTCFPVLAKESEDERIRNGLIGYFRAGKCENISSYHGISTNDILTWLEKQGEQKSADIRTTGYWNVQEVEQKPAWSEEDERILVEMLKIFNIENFEGYNIGEDNEDALKFLKSLKSRVIPQPKQEWGEEDERNLNDAILFIETGTYSLDKDNLINWLKFLSPQSHWKPSEEQLKSLQEVIDAGHFTSYPNALETLYEQLKRLKEE